MPHVYCFQQFIAAFMLTMLLLDKICQKFRFEIPRIILQQTLGIYYLYFYMNLIN